MHAQPSAGAESFRALLTFCSPVPVLLFASFLDFVCSRFSLFVA
jgi:hypothetical protein